jgi:calcineurin-like phosphoesterase family protein
MEKKWFTSDLHLGHRNLAKLRLFPTAEDMDEALINNWHSVVKPGDVAYFLFDLTLTTKRDVVSEYFSRLNGTILVVSGNHDNWSWQSTFRSKQGIEVTRLKLIHEIKVDGLYVIMCHYPLREWPRYFRNSIHIHGHVHGMMGKSYVPDTNRQMDIGTDTNKYYPYSLGTIVSKLNKNST